MSSKSTPKSMSKSASSVQAKSAASKPAPKAKPQSKTSKLPKSSLGDEVMAALNDEKVRMHSRAYFVATAAALAFAAAAVMFFGAIFLSILYREIVAAGSMDLSRAFNDRGDLIASLPYLLILAIGLSWFLLYRLANRSDFSYKHRQRVVVAAVVLATTGLSVWSYNVNAARSLPFDPGSRLGTLNRTSEKHIVIGEVVEVDSDSIIISSRRGRGRARVIIKPDTKGDFEVEVGSHLAVYGEWSQGNDYGFSEQDVFVAREVLQSMRPGDSGRPHPERGPDPIPQI